MDLAEVLDRYTILSLKMDRIGGDEIIKAYKKYSEYIAKNSHLLTDDWIKALYEVNGQIWDLEFDIRKGKEGELGLEEVGRRAIQIRDLNKKRITIKNRIIEATGQGFKDVKMNHASE